MYVTQHIRAPQSPNGNPRRCYVLYNVGHYHGAPTADLVDVKDEGYAGKPTEWREYPELAPVNVSYSEYKAFLAEGK